MGAARCDRRAALPRLGVLLGCAGLLGLALDLGCKGDGTADHEPTATRTVTDPPGTPAPATPPARVDEMLAPVIADQDLPALGALVLRDGAVVAEGVAGVRRLGSPALVTTSDAWSLGSDAQVLTATLAATLVEEGKLAWSSTLGATLPDVAMHASYKDVPLDALLGHRGGAPVAIPSAVDATLRGAGTPRDRREAAVKVLLASAPESTPLADYQASDAGYLMVALMLERVAGRSWEDSVRERVLDKLGMTGCEYGDTFSSKSDAIPWGHIASDGTIVPVAPGSSAELAPALGPAGAVRCPLRDWAKLCALHLAGARREHTAILGEASFLKLQSPGIDTRALGWSSVSRPWAGALPALNQSSNVGLAHALVWVLPDKNTILMVATNRGDQRAVQASGDAMAQLIGRFVPKE